VAQRLVEAVKEEARDLNCHQGQLRLGIYNHQAECHQVVVDSQAECLPEVVDLAEV
jgi:hypothetical protein